MATLDKSGGPVESAANVSLTVRLIMQGKVSWSSHWTQDKPGPASWESAVCFDEPMEPMFIVKQLYLLCL